MPTKDEILYDLICEIRDDVKDIIAKQNDSKNLQIEHDQRIISLENTRKEVKDSWIRAYGYLISIGLGILSSIVAILIFIFK